MKCKMKKEILWIFSALICGVVFTGCSSNEVTKEEKLAGELYVIGANSVGSRSEHVNADNKTDLVFTGDDIKSYNVNTGEIVFVESKLDEIKSRLGLWSQLDFFIGDKSVFVPSLWIHSGFSSGGADDLHLRLGYPVSDKIYFSMFFNGWEWLPESERKVKQKEQDEVAKKRKKELDVLIGYLSGVGKIDNTESPELPPEILEPTYPEVVDSLRVK